MTTTTFHSLPRAISTWAAIQPGAPAALAIGLPDITWRTLDGLVATVAAVLRAEGVGPGDPVILLMPPSRDALVLSLAVACAAPAVPLDPRISDSRLSAVAARIAPRLALASPEHRERAQALGCPVIDVLPGPALVSDAAMPPGVRPGPGPESVALLLPDRRAGNLRLIPRTHRQLVASGLPFASALGLGPGDRWLDLGLSTGDPSLTGAAAAILSGGSICVPASEDPTAAATAIRILGPTWASAPPARADAMLAALEGKPSDAPLRMLAISGAHPDAALAARLREAGVPAVFDYSLPEAPHIGLGLPAGEDARDIALRPLAAGTLAIAGADGSAAQPGESGEIVTAGPHCFSGYIGGGEEVGPFLPSGWLPTGNRGLIDETGALIISAPPVTLIDRGGTPLDPAEVEAVLRSHPGIAAAAVYAVEDEVLGQDIRAAVVPRPGEAPSPREVRRWMLDHLPVARVPRSIAMLEALPLTPTGEIDRAALPAAVAAAAAAEAAPAPDPGPAPEPAPTPGPEIEALTAPDAAAEPEPTLPTAPAPPPASSPADDSGSRIRGPVAVVGGIPSFGEDGPLPDRIAFVIVPETRLRRMVARLRCDDAASDGRLFHVRAGEMEEGVLLRPVGAFGLEFAIDLAPGEPAGIAFFTAPARRGTARKGGKKKRRKQERRDDGAAAPPLGFTIEAIHFDAGPQDRD